MAATAPGTVRVTDGAEGLNGSHHEAFGEALARTVAVLGEAGLPFAVLGGVASAGLRASALDQGHRRLPAVPRTPTPSSTRWPADGFEVERTNPAWIYKAFRDGVQVDVIFKGKGGIFFDERMAERVQTVTLVGVELPAISPEDLIVLKALSHDEESPRHWHDALGVLASADLDWDYLLDRARLGPNRVLALLHYSLSVDVPVPTSAINQLHALVSSTWS